MNIVSKIENNPSPELIRKFYDINQRPIEFWHFKKDKTHNDSLSSLSIFNTSNYSKKPLKKFNRNSNNNKKIPVAGGVNFFEEPLLVLNSCAESRALGRMGLFGRGTLDANQIFRLEQILKSREYLLSKVKNKTLYGLIDTLYRPNARFGTGSTADAVRIEARTGKFLSKTGHAEKASCVRTALRRLMAYGNLNADDKHISKILYEDLSAALLEKQQQCTKEQEMKFQENLLYKAENKKLASLIDKLSKNIEFAAENNSGTTVISDQKPSNHSYEKKLNELLNSLHNLIVYGKLNAEDKRIAEMLRNDLNARESEKKPLCSIKL